MLFETYRKLNDTTTFSDGSDISVSCRRRVAGSLFNEMSPEDYAWYEDYMSGLCLGRGDFDKYIERNGEGHREKGTPEDVLKELKIAMDSGIFDEIREYRFGCGSLRQKLIYSSDGRLTGRRERMDLSTAKAITHDIDTILIVGVIVIDSEEILYPIARWGTKTLSLNKARNRVRRALFLYNVVSPIIGILMILFVLALPVLGWIISRVIGSFLPIPIATAIMLLIISKSIEILFCESKFSIE